MNDLQVQPPFCDPVYDTNCGYLPVVPILYFYSFLLLTEYTMLKLVVAVILDNFSSTVDMDLEKEVRMPLAVRVLVVPVIARVGAVPSSWYYVSCFRGHYVDQFQL